MSSTTPNLGLTKTTAAETIGQNWAASNDSGGNFDIIDTKMGAVGNTSLQEQVTALNSNLANLLKVTDATGTVSNLSPHGAVSVPLSLAVPEGYRLYMYGPLRTSGFVGGGYMLNNTTAWVFNPTDNTVSGTVVVGVLCIKNL